MPYIGKSANGFGIRETFQYTATSNQTAFTGSDINSKTLSFDNGSLVDVLLNGITLKPTTDYNTSTANTITLTSGATASDEVMIIVYDVFSLSDAMPKTGGTFSGAVTNNSTTTLNDDVTLTGTNGNIVFDKSADSLILQDNVIAKFGSSGDLFIQHNGSHSYITDFGTGGLLIGGNTFIKLHKAGSSETMIYANADGSVDLYYDNAKKFETTSTGIDVTGTVTDDGATHDGDVTFTGDNYNVVWDKSDNALEFADNAKATFGDDANLQISHNGSNSLINDAGSGNLNIKTNGTSISLTGASDYLANFTKDGAVELYYDNSKKLETTSAGALITGSLDMTLQPSIAMDGNGANVVSFTANKIINEWSSFHTVGITYNSSNGRFTVPTAGKYLILVNIYLYQNNEFQRLSIQDNGSDFVHNTADYKTGDGDIGQDITLSCTAIRDLSANDYITFMMLGGGTDRIYMGGGHSHCAIHKLS